MATVLEARQLVKRYQQVVAVNGLDLRIDEGQCVGLLGPNGAGKTTTLEMLEGIKKPTTGEIFYRGEAFKEQFRYVAGIMFQATALQDYLTTQEALELFARFYPRTVPIEQLIEQCELSEFLDRDHRKLSGGQKQRLLLAIALLNDPDVLFLDEPTTGLDPHSRRNFWDLIRTIKQQGKTVILSTHYMEEAQVLCDTIAIMNHGKIVSQGTPRELLKAHFAEVILELPLDDWRDDLASEVFQAIPTQQHIELFTSDVQQTLQQLMAWKIPLQHLRIRERTLDDLFVQLM